MENKYWQDTGSIYGMVVGPTADTPVYAFAVHGEDGHIYYYSAFDIKAIGGTVTVCFICDATDFNNENIAAGLRHFRKASLSLQDITQKFIDAFLGQGSYSFLSDVKKKLIYKIIGCIFTLSLKCEEDPAKYCFEPFAILIDQGYKGKRLVHRYFDFLTIMSRGVNVLKENLSITDADVDIK